MEKEESKLDLKKLKPRTFRFNVNFFLKEMAQPRPGDE